VHLEEVNRACRFFLGGGMGDPRERQLGVSERHWMGKEQGVTTHMVRVDVG
jgi:hypothetical protein